MTRLSKFVCVFFAGCVIAITTTLGVAHAQSIIATVSALHSGSNTDPYIILEGYNAAGDGGGGMLVKGASGCTDNGGTIFKNSASTCYYRTSSTGSAREFGAYCDVKLFNQNGGSYTPTGTTVDLGTILPASAQGLPIVIYNIGAGPWSLLETHKGDGGTTDSYGSYLTNAGSAYAEGDIVTFTGGGGTATQVPQIVVDSVTGMAIKTFHFINHGSYTALPSGTITASSGGAIMQPFWSGSTFSSTLATVSGTTSTVTLGSTPGISGSGLTSKQYLTDWYYGHDDNSNISTGVLKSALTNLGNGNFPTLVLPGNCGVSKPISLPNNVPSPTSQNSNPTISGQAMLATGLYALGSMQNLVSKDTTYSRGGGLSEMTLEGGGLTSGAVLEVDGGNNMAFQDLQIRDAIGIPIFVTGTTAAGSNVITGISSMTGITAGRGISDTTTPGNIPPGATVVSMTSSPNTITLSVPAIGPGSGDSLTLTGGNASFVCGDGAGDNVQGNHYDNLRVMTDQSLFSGAQFPDNQLLTQSGCSDSYFFDIEAMNATLQEMDIASGTSHVIHPHTFNNLWPNVPYADPATGRYPVSPALAQHGISITASTQLTGAQVDNATLSDIYVAGNGTSSIDGAHLNCGDDHGLPSSFIGAMELAPGVQRVNVTGITTRDICNFLPQQIAVQDGNGAGGDASTQVFGNTSASLNTLAIPGPEGRLSLSSTAAVMTGDVSGASTIYYLPYTGMQVPVWGGGSFSMQLIGGNGNGNVIAGQTDVPNVTPSSILFPGQPVQGTNIPTGTTVSVINPAPATPTTATGNLLGTTTISGITVTSGTIVSGMTVTDTTTQANIPFGATVVSYSAGTAIISVSATTSASGDSLSFSGNSYNLSGTFTSGSTSITSVNYTTNLIAGMALSDTTHCIAPGTYIVSAAGTTIVMSQSTLPTCAGSAFTANGGTIVRLSNTPTATAYAGSLSFQGVPLSLDNKSGNSGYQQAQKNFDLFFGNDGSNNRLCTGPAWASAGPGSASRGSGAGTTQITQIGGYWVNAVSMACKEGIGSTNKFTCAPYFCTYLGTMYATANGQTTMQFGPTAQSGGNCNMLGLYNAYNQVPVVSASLDTNATYTYSSATWRAQHAKAWSAPGSAACNAIAFVDGLPNINIHARLDDWVKDGGSSAANIGLNVNSTSATPASQAQTLSTTGISISVSLSSPPQLGLNYVQAMEQAPGGTSASFGNGSGFQTITLHIND